MIQFVLQELGSIPFVKLIDDYSQLDSQEKYIGNIYHKSDENTIYRPVGYSPKSYAESLYKTYMTSIFANIKKQILQYVDKFDCKDKKAIEEFVDLATKLNNPIQTIDLWTYDFLNDVDKDLQEFRSKNNINPNRGVFKLIDKYNKSYNKLYTLKDIPPVDQKSLKILPRDAIFTKDAIEIDFAVDKDNTTVRRLTPMEMDKLMEYYLTTDGRYFYTGQDSNIFVTRDELIDLLDNRYFAIVLAFRYKVNVEPKSILQLKYNIEDLLN